MATLADLQNQRAQFFKQKGEQAQGQIEGQTQANVGALQRRFTSMGAANTGAALQAEQKAREEGLSQQRQAQTELAGQQLQAGEGDIGRAFQSEQAQLGREAQLGESRAEREARIKEAQLGREAALGESAAARAFQEKMAGQDIGFKRELAQIEQSNKLKEMDLAKQQFDIDKDTTAFNKRMAAIQAGIALDDAGMPVSTLAQQQAQKGQELEAERLKLIRDMQMRGGGGRTSQEWIEEPMVKYENGKWVKTEGVRNPYFLNPNSAYNQTLSPITLDGGY